MISSQSGVPKMRLFISLTLVWLFPIKGIISCSSEIGQREIIVRPTSVFSSAVLDDSSPERVFRQAAIPIPKYIENSDACQNLLPGAEQIIHGVNLYYFGMNASDAAPTTSPWTVLTCPSGTKQVDRGFDKPIQFESQTIRTAHVYGEMVRKSGDSSRAKSMFVPELYRAGLFTMLFGGPEAYQLASFVSHESEKTVVTYHVEEYRVKLFGGLEPTSFFKEFWNSLQQPYTKNELQYHQFLREFGTHMLLEATFGGRLFLSISSTRREETVQQNVRTAVPPGTYPMEILKLTNPHFRENITERVYVSQGGMFRTDRTIGDWADSVRRSPTATAGTKISIAELMDSTNTPRKEAFFEATEAEANHHTLRRCLTVVEIVQPASDLKSFIIKQTKRELRFVTPRVTFVRALQAISEVKEDFSEYTIKCRGEAITESSGKFADTTIYELPVMIDICTSFSGLPVKIRHASWKLPVLTSKPDCIKLYEGSSCTGQEIKITQPKELLLHVNKIRSFNLCY